MPKPTKKKSLDTDVEDIPRKKEKAREARVDIIVVDDTPGEKEKERETREGEDTARGMALMPQRSRRRHLPPTP